MWREYILSICGDKIQNKFIVKYEDFLDNKEKFFFSLFEGKQINLKTNMSNSYYVFLSEENKDIHPDIKKNAIKTNTNKWELGLSIKEKKIIGYVCRDLLGKMSYDKIDSEMNLFELSLYLYYKMRIFFKIDSY